MHVICLWLASTAIKASMMCTMWSQQISVQRLCFDIATETGGGGDGIHGSAYHVQLPACQV